MSRHSHTEIERCKSIASKMSVETGEAKAHSSAPPCSAFLTWFNNSSWAGAGKDAGELAAAAWNACAQAAADAALNHKLWAKDQTGAGFYGAVKMLRTDTPNSVLGDTGAKQKDANP